MYLFKTTTNGIFFMQVNNLVFHRVSSEVCPWRTDSQVELLYIIYYHILLQRF